MNGLKTFYGLLSNTNKDIFLQLVGEFSMSISQSIREEIEEELTKVTSRIDKINSERELLGSRAELLSKFSKELDRFSKKKDTSLEIVLLKQFFNQEEDKLRREIAELRPDDLLKEKYELKNNLKTMQDKMESFSKINFIMHLILKKKRRDDAGASIKEKISDDDKKEATKELVVVDKEK